MNDEPEEKPQSVGSVAWGWWNGLRPDSKQRARKRGNPGALARLRRADLVGAATEEITIDLFKRLASLKKLPADALFERTALIACVLSHVREDDYRRVATAAGAKTATDQRVLHPLRLRRLFAARTPADCLTAFRRLVALLGERANVADLAESLLDWPDEKRADRRRTRWAFDYYGAATARPEDQDEVPA
jgi:CRISPR system Cascade subunit CasB